MLASKTLFVLLSVTVLAYLVAGHEPCDYDYYYRYKIRTPEKCAAKCASCICLVCCQIAYTTLWRVDKGRYGECFAWTMPLSGSGNCIHFYIRYDDSLGYGDRDHCGLNPVPSVNNPTDSDSDEAPSPESAPTGCRVNIYTTDLGYAPTKENCESACLGRKFLSIFACFHWNLPVVKSNRYSACLLWLWDEKDKKCEGIMVEDSNYNACGTPSTMPL